MKINNIKIMGVFATVLLLVIVITASFAYFGSFNVNLSNNVAVNINASSPGDAIFVSTATQLNLQVPAANMSQAVANNETAAKEDTAYLDVTLTGSENLLTTCTYDIVYKYDDGSNVYGEGTTTKTGGATKEITIEVNGMNGNNHFASETNFDKENITSYYDSTNKYYKLVEGATIQSLGSEQSVRWKIIGRYYNLTASQAQLGGKSFTGKIYAVSKGCTSEDGSSVKKGYETVLANNGGVASMTTLTSTDFATSTTASDKGMYKAEDDLGTSYYFRGAVDNNWVKYGKFTKDKYIFVGYEDSTKWYYRDYSTLNECISSSSYNVDCTKVRIASKGDDMYWRIIRINGDNSIRMIYAGTYAPDVNTKVAVIEESYDYLKTSIGYSKFNQNSGSSEYAGYMYTMGEQHGTGTNSTIKTYLEDWYANYTDLGNLNTKVIDQVFCNDRSVPNGTWSSTGNNFSYGGDIRFSNASPSLKCENANDKFTVTNEKGNGVLTYPVGLITIDEVNMAGLKDLPYDEENYLFTGGESFWTGTASFWTYLKSADTFVISDTLSARDDYSVNESSSVRPVISLSSEAKLLGDGTYNNVYTVS